MLLAAASASLAAAATDIVVESWDTQQEGQSGVPDGWQKQNWGSPKYDFTIVSESGERALRLKSNNDSSTISKEITFPWAVRSRIIGYIWDTTAPVGSIFPSQKVGTVTFVVLRSGEGELNRWLTETRNVLEDYTRIYGEAPKENVGVVSISINSQNTGTSAESFFGAIAFKRK